MKNISESVFADLLRKKINNGEFSSKDDLARYLKDVSTNIFSNGPLAQQLKNEGITLDNDSINKFLTELLDYYDKARTNPTSLNLDGVSGVKVDGTEYIKIKDSDNNYTLLDDSMNKDNFVKQFQDRQNASFDYQTVNGVKNRDEIIKDMAKDKEEANLTASTDVNTRNLTPEERQEFKAVMNMNDADVMNFVVDTERNIYLNRDAGEIYYAYKNKEGKMEVRKANEQTVETKKEEVEYVDEMGEENTFTTENPSDTEFENLDDFELQYIVDNRFDSLTEEQQQKILAILERRKALSEKGKEMVKEDVKVKRYGTLEERKNGFSDVLILALLTWIYGLGVLLYVVLKVV